jgi:hypothetical protein
MRRTLSRTRWSAVLLTGLMALAASAAPVAQAAKPVRTVLEPTNPFVVPAGQGCAFDVLWSPHAGLRRQITEFADGRVVTNANGEATLTNLETSATFEHLVRFHALDTYAASTNSIVSTVDGQVMIAFWPGDQGPYGVVGASGATLRFTGHVETTIDADTFAITQFRSSGRILDVCAVLS